MTEVRLSKSRLYNFRIQGLVFDYCIELTEGLYQQLQGSMLRIIVFDGLDKMKAEKIKKLRPMPTFVVIFASSSNMSRIFNEVNGT